MSEITEVHHTNSLSKITWLYICVCVSVCINEEKGMWQIQQPLMIQTLRKKEYRSTTSPWQKHLQKKLYLMVKKWMLLPKTGNEARCAGVLASGMRQRKERHSDWKKKQLPVLADPKESAKQLLELITGDFSHGSSG